MISIFSENDEKILVKLPYCEERIKQIKKIQGYRWHIDKKYWSIPYSEENVLLLAGIFSDCISDSKLHLSDEFKELILNQYGVDSERLSKIEEELKLKGYSWHTRKAYLGHIKRFTCYCKKPIDEISQEDIRRYLLFLLDIRKSSAAFVNQAYSALKFLFGFLGICRELEIPRCKKEKKLPKVISKEDVVKLLSAVDNIKHKALLMLIYSSGLRVSEVVRIRIQDIDGKRKMLRVSQAKGRKDRYTVLSNTALDVLRQYFKKYRPDDWLFPGFNGESYLSVRTVQNVFRNACSKANVNRAFSVHSLRHSFATHLLEDGIDIKYIQELLGHESCKTTEIYTHVTEAGIKKISSPLDKLNIQT